MFHAPRHTLTVYTIGHSNRTAELFLQILLSHQIQCLVDIRTIRRSRHNPQFNDDTLEKTLHEHGILYTALPGLGGLRRPRKGSLNLGWRTSGFRGFADHMLTEEFARGLQELLSRARRYRTAIMCAEALYWRCHRSLVADALTVRGVEVLHILDRQKVERHSLTSFASVEGERIIYPAPQGSLLE